jgi:hypothetical protein
MPRPRGRAGLAATAGGVGRGFFKGHFPETLKTQNVKNLLTIYRNFFGTAIP